MREKIEHFKVIGISHHLASVELREKFSINEHDHVKLHQHLKNNTRGGFVLTTCNRTEIYYVSDDSSSLINYWAELTNVQPEFLKNYLYKLNGKDAIDYIFRVGTGLDSQILGDFQIIGQIKKAYQRAIADGLANPKITRLIDALLKTSKRVKNETQLSSGVASMAYSAIQHVQTKVTNFHEKTAFVYGAGKMGSAVVRKLAELMPANQVLLANRTASKAEELSTKYSIKNVSQEDLKTLVQQSDFIISTPAVEKPVFTKEQLNGLDLSGKIFVDLSMPRSIDPNLGKVEGVELLNLDRLQDLQNETFETRKQSVPKAELIVEEELNLFFDWVKSRDIAPTIHALKEKLNIVKEVEIKKLQKDCCNIDQEQLEAIANALINKVTTQCIKHVKKHNGQSISLIHDIFELESKVK